MLMFSLQKKKTFSCKKCTFLYDGPDRQLPIASGQRKPNVTWMNTNRAIESQHNERRVCEDQLCVLEGDMTANER